VHVVPRDSSLDEFFEDDPGPGESTDDPDDAGGGDPPADGSADDETTAAGTGESGGSDPGDAPAPTPVRPTFGWSPDGDECESCGRRVTRHWREDGRRVCGDCKEW